MPSTGSSNGRVRGSLVNPKLGAKLDTRNHHRCRGYRSHNHRLRAVSQEPEEARRRAEGTLNQAKHKRGRLLTDTLGNVRLRVSAQTNPQPASDFLLLRILRERK